MTTLLTLAKIIQVLSALSIIGLVLLQHGKGADMGAAFGSGASGSLFGASGSSNFLSKSTAIAAAIFFSATLALAFFGTQRPTGAGGVMENVQNVPVPAKNVPAAAAPAAPQESAAQQAPAAPANNAGQANQIPK